MQQDRYRVLQVQFEASPAPRAGRAGREYRRHPDGRRTMTGG